MTFYSYRLCYILLLYLGANILLCGDVHGVNTTGLTANIQKHLISPCCVSIIASK